MLLLLIDCSAFRDFLISVTLVISACRKSDGVTKAAINEKRKLSANLAVTRAHLSLKAREGAIVWLCRSVALFIRISARTKRSSGFRVKTEFREVSGWSMHNFLTC